MKYTKHLIDSFYNSPYAGVISGADHIFKYENKETGDAVKVYFCLDNDLITKVKFQACGSIVLFASLTAICNLIEGKNLKDVLEVSEKLVIKEIKQVNRCDYATVCFALSAVHQAANSAIKKLIRLEQKGETLKKRKVKD